VSDESRDSYHRDERRFPSATGRDLAPQSESGTVYGPFQPPEDAGSTVVYEEFSCEDALLATVFDTERSDRWIQTTLVVPVEE